MDGEPVKVIAKVTMDRVRIDDPLEAAFQQIADSSSRVVAVVERMESPLRIFVLISGVSLFTWSLSTVITALRRPTVAGNK